MRKNKMSAFFLITILALAGIGISYAGWTDTITISGTVATGDVDITIVKTSGTWVWKQVDNHALIYHHEWVNQDDPMKDPVASNNGWYDNDNYIEVAYAVAHISEDDEITVTYNNLFPCQEFIADAVFHYDGSIPVIVDVNTYPDIYDITTLEADWPTDPWGDYDYTWDWVAYLLGTGDICGAMYKTTDPSDVAQPEDMPQNGFVDIGTQLHNCEYVKLDLSIHLPQDQLLMNRAATFTYQLGVLQWDEYSPGS